jgi:hypothetical protein
MQLKLSILNTTVKTLFPPKKVSQLNQKEPSRSAEEHKAMQGMLNSQRIKYLFKDYGVSLLLQEGNVRVSNLHANGLMRTCAVVNFNLPVPEWLQTTHDKILKGSTIGQTIKDDGLELIKQDAFIGITELPKFAKEKMQTEEKAAAVYVYQLIVKNPKTEESFEYCTITEAYSPEYLTFGDLQKLTSEGSLKLTTISKAVQKRLDDLIKMDEQLLLSVGKVPQK